MSDESSNVGSDLPQAGNQSTGRDLSESTSGSGPRTAKMSAWSAGAMVTASMIGAGVYTTSGFTLAALGSPGWVLLAWVVAGIVAVCGAVCYGALAERFTESGGEYLFLARAVHPAAGMVAGWVSLLAGFTGAMAFAATAFESYAMEFELPLFDALPQRSLAIAVVIYAAAVHSLGLRSGTWIQNATILLKFTLIAAFLLIAYGTLLDWPGLSESAVGGTAEGGGELSDSSGWSWGFVTAFAGSLTWISLSYSGFNAAVYLSGDITDPSRDVPRSMLGATVFVTLLYVLLNAVFVFAPRPEEIMGEKNVATAAANAIGRQLNENGIPAGRYYGGLIRTAIVAGLATSVLALMQTGPRVYRKMAEDGFLPRWLIGKPALSPVGEITPEPLRAIWIQAVLAVLVICISTLPEQLSYLGFTLSISAALCGSLVFFLRGHPEHDVRVRGFPLIPIIYVAGTLTIACLTAFREPIQALVGLATLMIGVVAYFISESAR